MISSFLNPIRGHGFNDLTTIAHNGYLSVAVALGVFGLVAYVLLLWSTCEGLFRHRWRDRLGYVGLTYSIAMVFTNTLWDRFAWLLLSLAIASAANRRYCVTEEDRPARLARPLHPARHR